MAPIPSEDRPLQLALLGAGGVGKSAITIRFIQNTFVEDYDPTIEDTYRKQIVVDSVPVALDILDTAGQEEYSAMRDQYIRERNGFLLVYAVNNQKSFDELAKFHEEVLRSNAKSSTPPPMVLVCNKCDLMGQSHTNAVNAKVALEFAEKRGMSLVKTSAKTPEGIEEAFLLLAREMLRRRSQEGLQAKSKKKMKKCTIV